MVMFDVSAGKYFSLNEIATAIWNRLETAVSVEELCEELTQRYDVQPEVCQKEVIALLTRLQDRQLIQVAE